MKINNYGSFQKGQTTFSFLFENVNLEIFQISELKCVVKNYTAIWTQYLIRK